MFTFLFGKSTTELEIDPMLEAATETLMGRMQSMLERDTLRKLRFNTLETPRV